MYYLTFAGVVNVVLNLIFVLVFKMDVGGVALATIIAQALAAWLVIRCMRKETDAFHLDLHKLSTGQVVVEICARACPPGSKGLSSRFRTW